MKKRKQHVKHFASGYSDNYIKQQQNNGNDTSVRNGYTMKLLPKDIAQQIEVDLTSPEQKPIPYNTARDNALDDITIANNVVFHTNDNSVVQQYMRYIGKYVPSTEMQENTKVNIVVNEPQHFDNIYKIPNTNIISPYECHDLVGGIIEVSNGAENIEENALYNCTADTIRILANNPKMEYKCMRGSTIKNLKVTNSTLKEIDSCMELESALLYLGLRSDTIISTIDDKEM